MPYVHRSSHILLPGNTYTGMLHTRTLSKPSTCTNIFLNSYRYALRTALLLLGLGKAMGLFTASLQTTTVC